MKRLAMKDAPANRPVWLIVASLLLAPLLVFSVAVLLVLLAAAGAGLAAWFWWKTRAARRAMAAMSSMAASAQAGATGAAAGSSGPFDSEGPGTIIEGESQRVADEEAGVSRPRE